MKCLHPTGSDFLPYVCVRPRNHPGPHMDGARICPWDTSYVHPDGAGPRSPVFNENGVVFHAACLRALEGERFQVAA